MRIPRKQQLVELGGDLGDFGGQARQLGPGQRGQIRIRLGCEVPSLVQIALQ